MGNFKGSILKKYLEENGIKVTDFANEIGVSRQNAYLIFGRKNFDKDLLQKLKITYPDLILQKKVFPRSICPNIPLKRCNFFRYQLNSAFQF